VDGDVIRAGRELLTEGDLLMAKRMAENWLRASCARTARAIVRDQWRASFPDPGAVRNHEIKLIHMRHEQATAYAADAYGPETGEVGVCMVTAGCGLTQSVTGLCSRR